MNEKPKTDLATLKAADWEQLENDVIEKLRILEVTALKLEPGPMSDKIADELILPCLELLAQFCACVTIGDKEPTP